MAPEGKSSTNQCRAYKLCGLSNRSFRQLKKRISEDWEAKPATSTALAVGAIKGHCSCFIHSDKRENNMKAVVASSRKTRAGGGGGQKPILKIDVRIQGVASTGS
jgi:hypothetical protein